MTILRKTFNNINEDNRDDTGLSGLTASTPLETNIELVSGGAGESQVLSHNSLRNIQGGSTSERYHLTEDERDSISGFDEDIYKRFISTGLLSGGHISINADPAYFDIDETDLIFVDNAVDPPIKILVTVPAATHITPQYLLTNTWEELGIDSSGNFVFKSDDVFSSEERRSIVQIGEIIHPNMETLDVVRSNPEYMGDKPLQISDFLNSWGVFNVSGNIYYAGGGLTLRKTEGWSFFNNVNYANDLVDPNIIHSEAEETDPIDIYYYYRDGVSDWINDNPTVTNIDPNHWDNGYGTLINVTTGYWTIQPVAFYSNYNSHDIQYGQVEYATLAAAKAALRDLIIVNPYNGWDIFRAWIIVKQGATNLLDSTQCLIYEAPRIPISDLATGGAGSFPGIASVNGKTGVEIILETGDLTLSVNKVFVTDNQKSAADAANNPGPANAFATMNDIPVNVIEIFSAISAAEETAAFAAGAKIVVRTDLA